MTEIVLQKSNKNVARWAQHPSDHSIGSVVEGAHRGVFPNRGLESGSRLGRERTPATSLVIS